MATPPMVAAGDQAGQALNCTVETHGKQGHGGKRPGAGRPALPVSKLRRPDLADWRQLKKPRPR